MSHPVKNQAYDFGQTSNNFRWSAAVAEFGLLLRASEFKGVANYQHCKEIAEAAKGKDPFGYRQQMIDMIIAADQLSATTAEK